MTRSRFRSQRVQLLNGPKFGRCPVDFGFFRDHKLGRHRLGIRLALTPQSHGPPVGQGASARSWGHVLDAESCVRRSERADPPHRATCRRLSFPDLACPLPSWFIKGPSILHAQSRAATDNCDHHSSSALGLLCAEDEWSRTTAPSASVDSSLGGLVGSHLQGSIPDGQKCGGCVRNYETC